MRGAPILALLGLASGIALPREHVTSSVVPSLVAVPTSSQAQPRPTDAFSAQSVDKGTASTAAATCSNPLERKEWRQLSNEERRSYINAVKCLHSTAPEAGYEIAAVQNILDDMTYTHNSLAGDIHFVAQFLPWHRWILARHESLLRNMCGYTGAQPYWDWTKDAEAGNVAGSAIWDPETGFGGNGAATGRSTSGYVSCVADGPFANYKLTLGRGSPNQDRQGNEEHCLNRRFNNGRADFFGRTQVGDMRASTYNAATMNAINRLTRFEDFASALERQPHGQVHNAIGGDMSPTTAPNDPIFYLHHANVDRAWAKVCLLWRSSGEVVVVFAFRSWC
jgi:tyrosinase